MCVVWGLGERAGRPGSIAGPGRGTRKAENLRPRLLQMFSATGVAVARLSLRGLGGGGIGGCIRRRRRRSRRRRWGSRRRSRSAAFVDLAGIHGLAAVNATAVDYTTVDHATAAAVATAAVAGNNRATAARCSLAAARSRSRAAGRGRFAAYRCRFAAHRLASRNATAIYGSSATSGATRVQPREQTTTAAAIALDSRSAATRSVQTGEQSTTATTATSLGFLRREHGGNQHGHASDARN